MHDLALALTLAVALAIDHEIGIALVRAPGNDLARGFELELVVVRVFGLNRDIALVIHHAREIVPGLALAIAVGIAIEIALVRALALGIGRARGRGRARLSGAGAPE